MWGGSEGEGEGDRGRLKRKGLVGLGESGAVVEVSSGAEAMVRRLGVGHLLATMFFMPPIYVCVAKQKLLQMRS